MIIISKFKFMIHFRTTTLQMSDTETEDKRSPGSKSDADGALESNIDKESTINGEAKEKVDFPCEEVCEIIDEESNISQSGDVITVEDTGENALPSKTIPDAVFFASVSEEEKQYYEDNSLSQAKLETFNVRCTACWKQVNHHVMNSVMRHPVLGVAICRYCRDFYEGDGTEDGWEKDEEGLDLYCRWCGQGGEVLGCDNCQYVYCKKCITRNLGRKKFSEINDSESWSCFSCEPSQIYKERCLMFVLSKWMSELKQKKRLKDKLKAEKKKTEQLKRKAEVKQKQKEAIFEAEANKVENFVDEAFHEAIDTLNIYQKCLEDEQKKWIKTRKSMTAVNTATVVKSLRKIFSITRQNMELLDSTLVQGYEMVYPEEGQKKIKVAVGFVELENSSSQVKSSSSPRKMQSKPPGRKRKRKESAGDDIAVEQIVVNGESVFDTSGDPDDGFDPSQLCSVEITSMAMERGSSSEPEVKKPKSKINSQTRGPLKLSNSMFKKRRKHKSPLKKKTKRNEDQEIEEITLSDDEENTSYVTQSETQEEIIEKANKFINNTADDSDVSLE